MYHWDFLGTMSGQLSKGIVERQQSEANTSPLLGDCS